MNSPTNGALSVNPLGKPKRMIVFDYYDGPVEGVIQFADRGAVFHFRLLGDQPELATSDKSRNYLLHALPADAIDRIAAAIEPYIPTAWPVWVPLWKFPSPEDEAKVEAMIETILAEAEDEEWQVSTASPHGFDDYRIDRPVAP